MVSCSFQCCSKALVYAFVLAAIGFYFTEKYFAFTSRPKLTTLITRNKVDVGLVMLEQRDLEQDMVTGLWGKTVQEFDSKSFYFFF